MVYIRNVRKPFTRHRQQSQGDVNTLYLYYSHTLYSAVIGVITMRSSLAPSQARAGVNKITVPGMDGAASPGCHCTACSYHPTNAIIVSSQ